MFGDYYRGKRVLVTGHTGFKGSWISEWLLSLGARVSGYSIDVPTRPSLFEAAGLEKRLEHFVGDVREGRAVREVMERVKPEVVIHMAAQPLVRLSYDQPVETFAANAIGTAQVLDACRRVSELELVVNITTDKVYENHERSSGYREDEPLGGHDPYSASKACAEIVFQSYFRSFYGKDSKVALVSVRAGNVIGGGDWAADRLVPDCVRSWSRGEKVRVRYPQSVRPWQHVLEPLSAYLWVGAEAVRRRAELNGEAFNFGPSDEVNRTVGELLQEFVKHWSGNGWEVDPSAIQGKREAGLLMLSSEKARKLLGWSGSLSFEETIRMTADWYRSYYAGGQDVAALTRNQISEYVEISKSRKQRWAD